ncbi:MAG: TonB family protein [Devosia sp.]
MRLALPASAALHCGALAFLLLGFAWPEADDAPAPAPVSVSVVSVSSVTSNATELVESDATVNALSAGSEAPLVEPETPQEVTEETETLEPVESEDVVGAEAETVTAEPLPETIAETLPQVAEASPTPPAEPLPAETVTEPVPPAAIPAELTSTAEDALPLAAPAPLLPAEPVEAIPPAPIAVAEAESEPAQPKPPTLAAETPPETLAETPLETVAAVEETELSPSPFPRPRSERPVAEPAPPRREPPPETRPVRQQQPPPRRTAPGAGGNSTADSVAAAAPSPPRASGTGSGGSADVARYPSQVIGKLRNALRRAGGQSGEVMVRFTVAANGSLSGASIARSSGNGALDQAALALVRRAAPFPPIPAGAGRSSWTFDVPLAFRR